MELQTNSELGEIKKDSCKAYMVTYQNSDSIKAGVHLGDHLVYHLVSF